MSREKLHLDRENLAQVITRCSSAPSTLQHIPEELMNEEVIRNDETSNRVPVPDRRKNSLPFIHVSDNGVGMLKISHGYHSVNKLSRSEGNLSFSKSFSSLDELSPIKKRRVSNFIDFFLSRREEKHEIVEISDSMQTKHETTDMTS